MGPFTCGEPLESEKLRSSTDAFSPPRPYFPSGSSTDAASLQKNIKRQPLKGPAEAEAAGLGPWGQVRLGFRREETNLVSPGGGRRASASAAPYPAASRTSTSALDATRIAAGRRAPQTRRSEQGEGGRETHGGTRTRQGRSDKESRARPFQYWAFPLMAHGPPPARRPAAARKRWAA